MPARLSAALAGLLLSGVLASAAAPPLPSPRVEPPMLSPPLNVLDVTEQALPPLPPVERQLKAPVSLRFEETPLNQVLDDLRDFTRVNIVADMPALRSAAVNLESPITVKLDQVSLKSALKLILHQVALSYVIKDEAVVITTEDAASGKLVTVCYEVRDLLTRRRRGNAETLVKLITNAVAPRSWTESGGAGTTEYLPLTRSLVISHTADVHERVADLLQALRTHGKRKKSD